MPKIRVHRTALDEMPWTPYLMGGLRQVACPSANEGPRFSRSNAQPGDLFLEETHVPAEGGRLISSQGHKHPSFQPGKAIVFGCCNCGLKIFTNHRKL
ncbi:hypothetical protein CEXT_372181 [Caerostris extrusa]|uniref:Uncharacterized protein n=1 Tax=Caerostris extrusa TaxID=172846 RepID=A0AAV4Q9F4_CAEEX|nr:hypothetical protein CEXT_372181 [Caerostris extrusa]